MGAVLGCDQGSKRVGFLSLVTEESDQLGAFWVVRWQVVRAK
jgi:hypothetical protein